MLVYTSTVIRAKRGTEPGFRKLYWRTIKPVVTSLGQSMIGWKQCRLKRYFTMHEARIKLVLQAIPIINALRK